MSLPKKARRTLTILDLICGFILAIAVFLWGYLFAIKTNNKKISEISYKIEQLKKLINEDTEDIE